MGLTLYYDWKTRADLPAARRMIVKFRAMALKLPFDLVSGIYEQDAPDGRPAFVPYEPVEPSPAEETLTEDGGAFGLDRLSAMLDLDRAPVEAAGPPVEAAGPPVEPVHEDTPPATEVDIPVDAAAVAQALTRSAPRRRHERLVHTCRWCRPIGRR